MTRSCYVVLSSATTRSRGPVHSASCVLARAAWFSRKLRLAPLFGFDQWEMTRSYALVHTCRIGSLAEVGSIRWDSSLHHVGSLTVIGSLLTNGSVTPSSSFTRFGSIRIDDSLTYFGSLRHMWLAFHSWFYRYRCAPLRYFGSLATDGSLPDHGSLTLCELASITWFYLIA